MYRTTKHVLVTGGAGYIGSVLIPHLLTLGYKVTVFDTFYFGNESIKKFKANIRVIVGDIRTPPQNLCKGMWAVIHLAALSNDPTAEFNPVANMQINRDGAITIARLAKRSGVKRFIFASSCSIYDKGMQNGDKVLKEDDVVRPKNPYSLSKYLAEQEILKLGTKQFIVTILRKGTVYGFSPRMRYDLIINTMVRDALRQKQLHVFSKGLQWRPLVSIEDVVEAYGTVLSSPSSFIKNQIFNIAEHNYQVKEVADIIVSVFKKNYHVILTKEFSQDAMADRSYQVSCVKAKRILGYTPKHRITDVIPLLVRSIQSRKKYMHYSLPIYYNIQHMKPLLEKMEK